MNAPWLPALLLPLVPLASLGAADAPPPLLDPGDASNPLGAAIAAKDLGEPLAAIEGQLVRGSRRAPQEGVLPVVGLLFETPWSLPEVAATIADALTIERHGHAAGLFAARVFATEEPLDHRGAQPVRSPFHGVHVVDYFLRGGDLIVREALEPIVGIESGPGDGERIGPDDSPENAPVREARAALARDALAFLDLTRRTLHPEGEDAELARRIGEAARKIVRAKIARAVLHTDLELHIECDWATAERMELPELLAGAVEGEILEVAYLQPVGWVVVGGPGPNRYDMSVVAGVFDPAGDDRYEWPADVVGSRVIVDLAGDDVYTSKGAVGPGGALVGFALVRDFAGNDRYEGTSLVSGAACFGVGVVIDEAGDDVHMARDFSQGAAIAGAGVLVDAAGSDLYEGSLYCQGVGGPLGAGAIFDRAGNDRYAAGGAASAYSTPATSRSFSQGVGFGVRPDLGGGVGLLSDGGGDDRYEGGEFSQGGGYYFALGVLADRDGRDLYHGDRYAQGFAAHQAFGALLEDAGDDVYWSRTAAGQGAAWDESAAVLVDRKGNDHYRADDLSQGAAAQQALAALVDLGGDDVFDARGGAVQGGAGGNRYRFTECGCYSLGVLLKRGGTVRLSRGRPEGEVIVSSRIVPDDPERSAAYGLLIVDEKR